jgi:predicted nucleotide-binding protein
MKIFLSWSGNKSGKVANALRDWIPMVLQYVEPWLSSIDIPQGAKWTNEIGRILNEVDYGLICLTRKSLKSSWLNYEAGALSKNEQSKVILIMVDVDYTDIEMPLAQFQGIKLQIKNDLWRLIEELNQATERPMPEKLISNVFENLHPRFETTIKEILNEEDTPKPVSQETISITSLESKVDEILTILRKEESGYPKNEVIERNKVKPITGKPKVFIGSSSEGLEISYALMENLDAYAEVTIWNQNMFDLSNTVIQSLVDTIYNFDFAIIVFTPDDILIKSGVEYSAPPGDLIFELGLFIGTLGRGRTFLVFDKDSKIHLPTGIYGVTAATFNSRQVGNISIALRPVCQRIKRAMGVSDK